MAARSEIGKVLNIIAKEVEKFSDPSVTKIARETSNDPYKVLVSCLLSLRTRDETTANASHRLYKLAETPKQMVKLKRKQIEDAIYPVGFYRVKAKRILDISRTLLDEYDGKVPQTMEELLKLRGVGRKTANIVMTYGFNNPDTIAVDIHCHRIPNRLGWVKTRNPNETEEELLKIVPRKSRRLLNNTLVTFGQNICKPISPLCSKCAVRRHCKRIGVKTSR